MAMQQQDDYIEQIHRLEANRPLRGFATLGEANTPSASESRVDGIRGGEKKLGSGGVRSLEWGSWELESGLTRDCI